MRKNYRKGIMKIDNIEDEITKFSRESFEEINRLPYFEGDGDSSDTISSSSNDGVENSKNSK